MDFQVKIEKEDSTFETNHFEKGTSHVPTEIRTIHNSDCAPIHMIKTIKQEFIVNYASNQINDDFNQQTYNSSGMPEQVDLAHLVDVNYACEVKREVPPFGCKPEEQEEFDVAELVKIEKDSLKTMVGYSYQNNSGMMDYGTIGPTSPDLISCNICCYVCSTTDDLNLHRFSHTIDSKYTCLICFKMYAFKKVLFRHILQHINNIHSDKEHLNSVAFICDICFKSFAKRKYLLRHRLIHFDDKPFKCKICGKLFNSDSNLATHTKIHSGEKPFKCEICSKLFRRRSHLQRHNQIHTGEKLYECEICHKRFQDSSNLRSHGAVHTNDRPFQCELCEKRFSLKGSLTVHTRVHTGEKLHECHICHKRFSVKNSLKKHTMKMHDNN